MQRSRELIMNILVSKVSDNRVATNLADIFFYDADVDQYDNSMRIKMADAISNMLKNGKVDEKDPEVAAELRDWETALRDLEAGAREFDEAAELARRAGL